MGHGLLPPFPTSMTSSNECHGSGLSNVLLKDNIKDSVVLKRYYDWWKFYFKKCKSFSEHNTKNFA